MMAAVIPLLFAAPEVPERPKPVMVHYMPWFQSPYSLGANNWGYHWTIDFCLSVQSDFLF